jgi:HEAT repeat protein
MPRLAPGEEEKLDPEARLKMDALSALGESKEDSLSFRTLREVALDRKQQRVLRETAMDALLEFRKFDVLPVFVEIAKEDTSASMQDAAISYIGQLSHNKNRSVETLSELFYAIPAYRMEQRLNVLGSIAEIGNEKAVDVLAKVARTNDRYEVRSEAVYYLGSIGSDRARAVLYELLRSK